MQILVNKIRLFKILFLYAAIILLAAALVYYFYIYEGMIYYGLTALVALGFLIAPFITVKFLKLININKPALVVNDDGVLDNLNAVKLGTVEWVDIRGIRTASEFYSKFIIVDLVFPEKYIIEKTGFEKIQMNGLIKKYGSPFVINTGSLNCNFDELQNLFRTYLAKK